MVDGHALGPTPVKSRRSMTSAWEEPFLGPVVDLLFLRAFSRAMAVWVTESWDIERRVGGGGRGVCLVVVVVVVAMLVGAPATPLGGVGNVVEKRSERKRDNSS